MTDKELIISVLDSDEKAFSELVKRYRKMVINTCYGFVHDVAEAEDISQEVFIEVYRSLKMFRGDSGFSTWLYRISVNKSLNYIRTKKRRKLFSSLENLGGDNSHSVKDASHMMFFDQEGAREDDLRIKMVQKGIDQLPKKQKTALVLHRYDNLKYKQISQIMGLSVAAVESLIYRAKVNLRKYIVNNCR